MKWKRFFSLLAAQQGKDGREVLDRKLDLEQLQVKTRLMRVDAGTQETADDKRIVQRM